MKSCFTNPSHIEVWKHNKISLALSHHKLHLSIVFWFSRSWNKKTGSQYLLAAITSVIPSPSLKLRLYVFTRCNWDAYLGGLGLPLLDPADSVDSDALSVDSTSSLVRGNSLWWRLCSLIFFKTVSRTASLPNPHSGKRWVSSSTNFATNLSTWIASALFL